MKISPLFISSVSCSVNFCRNGSEVEEKDFIVSGRDKKFRGGKRIFGQSVNYWHMV